MRVAQGVAQGVVDPFDLDQGLLGSDDPRIKDDPVGRREEVGGVGVDGPQGMNNSGDFAGGISRLSLVWGYLTKK